MTYFVGISLSNDVIPTQFHIAYDGLKSIGIEPEKHGLDPKNNRYLKKALDYTGFDSEENFKIREYFARMHLGADFGPPTYCGENWHDDELKLSQYGISKLKRLAEVNKRDGHLYAQASIQLEEAIRRVATGENELCDFPLRETYGDGPAKMWANRPAALFATAEVILGKASGRSAGRDLSAQDRAVVEEVVLSVEDQDSLKVRGRPRPLPPKRLAGAAP